jgi:hypothetical protein
MKNSFAFLFFLFSTPFLQAQMVEELSAPTQRSVPEDNYWHVPETGDTLKLSDVSTRFGFIDDFYYASHIPNPNLWEDRDVFVNYTYGIGMPSLGVATFDGLDENGRAYDITAGQVSRECDRLTSRHLDLSGMSDVYLSFLYQEGGNGEQPSNIDSLRLQFQAPGDSIWTSVWNTIGGAGPYESFKGVVVPVDRPEWLQKGFRFRFTNFGNPGGAFDVWNIDYVILNQGRDSTDTLITDVAYVRQHQTLIRNGFESMPWWVYGANPSAYNRSSVNQAYMRNVPPGSVTLLLSGYTLSGQGLNVFTAPNINDGAGHDQLSYQTVTWDQAINPFDAGLSPINDAFTLEMQSFFTGTAQGLRRSDTLKHEQFFGNYYAYDDGTAERAYGIANQPGAISLTSYEVLESDSLKGIYLYFQPASVDARNNAFQIIIYEYINGVPGAVLYESDSLYTPRFSEHNQFIPYPLEEPFFMPSGTYFIGTKQRDAQKLNVGFDMNNTGRSDLVYGDGTNWFPTIFSGSLMLRPYFRFQAPEISVKNEDKPGKWRVYPNPTQGRIRVEIPDEMEHAYSVRDLQGRIVAYGRIRSGDEIQLNQLALGTYLLLDGDTGQLRHKLILIAQ